MSWQDFKEAFRALTGLNIHNSAGICRRRVEGEDMTLILRSVDATPFYCDQINHDGPNDTIQYTFAGRVGDQNLEDKRGNYQLAHGTGRVYVYRVARPSGDHIFLGQYARGPIAERAHPDINGTMRRVYVMTLARVVATT